jgi:hypothetical protein
VADIRVQAWELLPLHENGTAAKELCTDAYYCIMVRVTSIHRIQVFDAVNPRPTASFSSECLVCVRQSIMNKCPAACSSIKATALAGLDRLRATASE